MRIETQPPNIFNTDTDNINASNTISNLTQFIQSSISDSLIVFSGKPGIEGNAEGPMHLRDGMNKFLAEVDITFRRDLDTKRPRINKPNSKLDREQKQIGEYYYGV